MSSTEASQTPSPTSPSTAPSSPPALDQHHDVSKAKTAAFNRWRPSFHIMPSDGWINDPCAPGFDSETGVYRISFQWNPNGCDWGDIAWGTATSTDMVSWSVQERPSLSPDQPYDEKGVFTGCLINARDGSLTYAYTSVSALPIHNTLPHQHGSESLSLARSFDHGKTWTKYAKNPVMPCEPEGFDVTGWRDPFIAPWPPMSRLLGSNDDETLFGIISGGIRDVTPTTFLYAIDANDLNSWTFVGPLVDFGQNLRPSRWSGDLGKNWEVTNFFTLNDDEDPTVTRDFLVMGGEGCLSGSPLTNPGSSGPSRPLRGQLWMSGSLRERKGGRISGSIDTTYDFGGHLDHGCLYAANSFFDP